jgi:hypothetical protein
MRIAMFRQCLAFHTITTWLTLLRLSLAVICTLST